MNLCLNLTLTTRNESQSSNSLYHLLAVSRRLKYSSHIGTKIATATPRVEVADPTQCSPTVHMDVDEMCYIISNM